MDDNLSQELDAAFSLLPGDLAQQAKARLLEARNNAAQFSLPLKWTEHDLAGNFLRGGITDMIGKSTRMVANSQEDPDINELAREAKGTSALAGAFHMLSDGKRFAFYLPFTPSHFDREAERRTRGFMVSEAVFREVLELMRPGVGLTVAERRVVFQLVAGMALREAATTDGVSFETKRAHLKVASAKLHCSGQRDLVRVVVAQLVHLLSVSSSEALHGEPAETFAARHLSDDVTLTVKRLPNGRVIRVYECGPHDGRPLIMIHGMMFPISLVGISRYLDTAGVRLIVPIRSGFLESRPPGELAAEGGMISESLSDLAGYIAEEWNGSPVAILGQSLGAVLAIRFANRYPGLVSRLILQSINLTQGSGSNGGGAAAFYGSLKRLSRDGLTFKLVNWQYQKYYADHRTGREILARLFGNCDVDMAVLDGKATGKQAYGMFSDLYRNSVFGMSNDFDFVMNSWEAEARKSRKPISFVHGEDDPLTKPGELERFAAADENRSLIVIPGGGHFIAASHPREFWQAIERFA
ncbi:alpha/beta hydrolase [Nitratireductor pacificus]|uniref:AB hydrolase-1 domain-containing protein n=1 Tax=Nitratireductor pacificus pht-3B TaxID=391937 RepID=K2LLM1_9HYPH|nr:alpha/beta hydrolase [Nitratireductor pacificus]EKF18629.1 hypothetical protein NA2_12054 [Nitratireductor pacificus pht-3B]